jgi:hypothetical protein
MQNKAETLYELLKTELGFSRAEADRYLIITEIDQAVVVRMRIQERLEPKTWSAFLALMQKLGAVHNENSLVFAIGTVSSHKEAKTDEKVSYSLASSKEGLGELVPVLVDKFGNIIDGFHRKGENANWREEVLSWIDTPEKLEAARLAVNFNRRQMAPEEIKERITFLIGKDIKPDEISKLTGISKSTIYKYMPQEAKNPARSEAGKAGGLSKAQSFATSSYQTEEHNRLVEALDTARYPVCPVCGQEPVQFSGMGFPYVNCLKGHEWHLQKGSIMANAVAVESQKTGTYLDQMEECIGCHLMVHNSRLVNGKCQVCRDKETENTKEASDKEMHEAPGQPEAPKKEIETIKPNVLKEPMVPITFLVQLPSTIVLSGQRLAELFTEHDYDETLPTRIVKKTDDGLTVSFEMAQWIQSNIDQGSPAGARNTELFEAELKSILEGTEFNHTEVEKITIHQLAPKLAEPEKPAKSVKEIDWNAQGVSCPCCGCTISQEKYQRLKEKFSKYPGLFAE